MNWIGIVTAGAAFFGIWLGHVGVRKIEFVAPNLWPPSLVVWAAGLGLEVAALLSDDLRLSAFLGILGVTLLWDGLEFWRQEKRVKKGHAPANPANLRHARILAQFPTATTVDWLGRRPQGRQLTAEELQSIGGGDR